MKYDERLHDLMRHFVGTLTRDLSMQQVLDAFTERTATTLEVDGAGVMVMGGDEQLHFVSASDETLVQIEQLQIDDDEGPCLRAYRTGQTVLVSDLGTDDRFPNFGPRAHERGLAAVFSFPMCHDGQVVGATDLYRRVPGGLTDDDVVLGTALAEVAAAFIANARSRLSDRELADDLREQALHDPLTGLPNRRLLDDRIRHAIAASERTDAVPAVLLCDLDHFKRVNDTHGHRTGDHLLVAVAERLLGVVRPGDTVARLGGDEFVVVCGDLHACGEADAVADRVREGLRQPFHVDGNTIGLSGSVGIACAYDRAVDPSDLLDAADRAMYAEKRAGRSDTRSPPVADEVSHDVPVEHMRPQLSEA